MQRCFGTLFNGRIFHRRFFAIFRREQSGTAAIEFAFVAIPFLLLLLAAMEVAMFFIGAMTLGEAVDKASRLIRTGEAHAKGFSQEQFKSEVCKHVVVLFQCEEGLKVQVESFGQFEDVDAPDPPLDDSGDLKESFSYDIGGAEDVMLVRVFYPWDALSIFPDFASTLNLANMNNGNTLMMGSATFRNEPFGGAP